MKLKKCFSIILAAVILLCTINISLAENDAASGTAQETYKLSSALEESYEVLTALGFINPDYTEEYIWQKQNEPVTRAAFADLVYKIFGKDFAGSDNVYFYDVPKTYYAFKAISALTEMNIISQSEDRAFAPEREITKTEAAKILIYALGYGTAAGLNGGWEAGINTVASRIKLYDGASSSDKVTFADMLIMTYNSLFAEILEATGVDKGNIVYETRGGTYLSEYYSIYKEKGMVTAYDGTDIYNETSYRDKAVIGGRLLNVNGLDLADHLGMEVKYIYYYNEDHGESDLLWLKKTTKSKELVLNRIDNSFEYEEGTNRIKYYPSGGTSSKSASLTGNFTLILNGSYVRSGITEIMTSDLYKVRLVASEGGNYDLVFADRYENYEVVTNDVNNEELYLKSCDNAEGTTYTSINLNEYDIVRITDIGGGAVAQDSIPAGSVISIFASVSKNKLRILVGGTTVKGKLSRIGNDDGYTVLDIQGTEYKTYKQGIVISEKVNSEIEVKLDAYGYIAAVKSTRGGVSLAYMVKIYLDDEVEGRSGDNILAFKMYTEEGNMVKLYAAEKKLMIDAVDYKNHEAAYNELGGTRMKPQLVAYSLNSNNELVMLDRSEPYAPESARTNNMLQCVQETSSILYNWYTKNMGPKARLGTSTVAFGVPGNPDGAKDSQYSVGGYSTFEKDEYYTVSMYVYGTDDYEFADAVVCPGMVFGVAKWVSTQFVIDKVREVVNDEDEVVIQLDGYHGDARTTINFTEEASEKAAMLKCGDIISVSNRIANDFGSFTLSYSPSTPEVRLLDRTYKASGPRKTMYYVNDVIGSSIYVGFDSGADFDEVLATGGARILVYEERTGKLTEGSMADIHTYKTHGDDCSSIFVYFVNGEVRNFVVYN